MNEVFQSHQSASEKKFAMTYEIVRELDATEPNEYSAGRSLPFENRLGFDFFKHLRELSDQVNGERVEVLDGGCGRGVSLEQLKRGLNLGKDRSFEGLGNKIRTTGATLSMIHKSESDNRDESYRIDDMRVGPIGQQDFNTAFDFILDNRGAAWYFPQEAIETYGKVLKPYRNIYMSLFTGAMPEGRHLELFNANGLEIEKIEGNSKSNIDVLLRKV